MDIVDYTQRFFILEKRLSLFDEAIDGVRWWDAVRHDVFYRVYDRISGISRPPLRQPSLPVRLVNYSLRVARRRLLWIRTTFGRHEMVVFRAPRTQVAGRRVDSSLDDVLAAFDCRRIVIDTYPSYYHRTFTCDRSVVVDAGVLERLEAEVTAAFDIRVPLADFIRGQVGEFIAQLRFYRRFFAKTSPRVVLITQNGIEKAMMLAAREAQIPLVEMQHGLINFVHPAYSYPSDVDYDEPLAMPSCLLTYSEFWSGTAFMPGVKKVPVGRPGAAAADPAVGSGPAYDFLVISTDKYDAILRDTAKQIASRFPGRTIGYKLHPKQTPQENAIRADLAGWPNIRVLGGASSVAPLLAASAAVVTVQSTVVYEALQAGKRILIVPQFDYMTHYDVLDLPRVRLLDSVETLDESMFVPAADQPRVFFDRFSSSAVREVLLPLLEMPPARTSSKRPATT